MSKIIIQPDKVALLTTNKCTASMDIILESGFDSEIEVEETRENMSWFVVSPSWFIVTN